MAVLNKHSLFLAGGNLLRGKQLQLLFPIPGTLQMDFLFLYKPLGITNSQVSGKMLLVQLAVFVQESSSANSCAHL